MLRTQAAIDLTEAQRQAIVAGAEAMRRHLAAVALKQQALIAKLGEIPLTAIFTPAHSSQVSY